MKTMLTATYTYSYDFSSYRHLIMWRWPVRGFAAFFARVKHIYTPCRILMLHSRLSVFSLEGNFLGGINYFLFFVFCRNQLKRFSVYEKRREREHTMNNTMAIDVCRKAEALYHNHK